MAKTKAQLLEHANTELGLNLDESLTKKEIQAKIKESTPIKENPAILNPAEVNEALEAAEDDLIKFKKMNIKGKRVISADSLLKVVTGIESEVAQLKHLESKINQSPEPHRVLVKQYDAQKAVVNGFLEKLGVVV